VGENTPEGIVAPHPLTGDLTLKNLCLWAEEARNLRPCRFKYLHRCQEAVFWASR
jgi:hypothetical protein